MVSGTGLDQNIEFLVGGWTNPSEKYARQVGSFPQVGKIKKCLKPPPRFLCCFTIYMKTSSQITIFHRTPFPFCTWPADTTRCSLSSMRVRRTLWDTPIKSQNSCKWWCFPHCWVSHHAFTKNQKDIDKCEKGKSSSDWWLLNWPLAKKSKNRLPTASLEDPTIVRLIVPYIERLPEWQFVDVWALDVGPSHYGHSYCPAAYKLATFVRRSPSSSVPPNLLLSHDIA